MMSKAKGTCAEIVLYQERAAPTEEIPANVLALCFCCPFHCYLLNLSVTGSSCCI